MNNYFFQELIFYFACTSPVFNPSVYAVTVAENTALNTLLTPVRATDGDATPAFANITYFIVAGDPLGNFR